MCVGAVLLRTNHIKREAIQEDINMAGTKREDYIGWDEYFMGVAMLSASDLELISKLSPISK